MGRTSRPTLCCSPTRAFIVKDLRGPATARITLTRKVDKSQVPEVSPAPSLFAHTTTWRQKYKHKKIMAFKWLTILDRRVA